MSDVNTPAPAAEGSVSESVESSESTENLEASEGEESAPEADASLSKAEQKEAVKQLRKLKLKVDGKDIEEEFDPADDEYLVKQFQKARAFEKRAQEYSALEKNVRNFVEELRKNPRKVLGDPNLGVDLKQLAASILEEEIQNSQKTPEQIEKEKLQNELNSMKEEREREKKEAQQKEFERIQEQAYTQYETQVEKALEKSNLPASPYIIGKIADYMLIGLQEKLDITPDDVIPLVRDEMQNDLKQMFNVMPDEVVEQLVGKDVINRLRKKNLAKAKEAIKTIPSAKAPDVGQSSKAEVKDDKSGKKTIKEMWGI